MDAGGRRAADAARRALGDSVGGHSDHLAVVAAFEGWEFAKQQGQERNFCAHNYLSFGTLQMMAGLRQQLRSALAARGIGTDRRAAGANSRSGAPPRPRRSPPLLSGLLFARHARARTRATC